MANGELPHRVARSGGGARGATGPHDVDWNGPVPDPDRLAPERQFITIIETRRRSDEGGLIRVVLLPHLRTRDAPSQTR